MGLCCILVSFCATPPVVVANFDNMSEWQFSLYNLFFYNLTILSSVHCAVLQDKDPSCHFDVDLDQTCHVDADPDPDPVLHQSDANLRPTGPSILSIHTSIESIYAVVGKSRPSIKTP